ncbi:hypothetical protein PHMEG_00012064 [Phytophthora megakarya]|uniref:RRM domain-containing protein n=1 Tax=Phytophthora megakarya TaxID=4795 RepID=A0A225WB52_9STRA|nr:hypothetical protein PHMEG_00012064 [Phytophthora megakarya]
MILDEGDKSSMIRVDRVRSCIAPKVVPVAGQDDEADTCTIYFDSFSATDDHDSLRRTFAKFGKVNLVSLPRFPQSKKFKGFGFVEFSEQSAAEQAVAKASDTDLRGIRVMSKARWLEMKEQLKQRLASDGVDASDKAERSNATEVVTHATTKKKKRRKQSGGHIHFGDEEEQDSDNNNCDAIKKQKV